MVNQVWKAISFPPVVLDRTKDIYVEQLHPFPHIYYVCAQYPVESFLLVKVVHSSATQRRWYP